jgi:hypothetical protein
VTVTWQKWGSKQTLEKRKTSLSLMEVFNIALKCRVFGFKKKLLNTTMVRMCKASQSITSISQRNPKCQNIDELRAAILQEWQQFPQERLKRLVRSVLQNFRINAVDILVIDCDALHIRTIDAFKRFFFL